MKAPINNIYIFKSNISTATDKLVVKDTLDMHPQIEEWSVDLEDEDYVLRIISSQMDSKKIKELVSLCGYTCEELD